MSLSKIFSYGFNISRGNIIATNNSNTLGNIFTTGGNVGIGTTSPSSRLHVAGSETSADGANAAIYIQNTASTNIWNLRAGASGTNTPNGGFSIADSITYRMVISSTGNVGIGTLTPTFGLDVAGTARVSTSLSAIGNNNTIGNIFTTGGNVGIGTTAPSFTLDVTGIARITNSVTTGGLEVTGLTDTLNLTATNVSSSTLVLSTGITTSNASITNSNVTNSTITSLFVSDSINTSHATQFSGNFSAANNVNSPTNVTNFLMSNSVYGSFIAILNVRVVTSTTQLNSQTYMEATQTTSGWLLNDSSLGDTTGITFTLTSSGQLQYTSINHSNWISTTFTYSVNGVKLGGGLTQSIPTSGNLIVSGNLTILNTTDIGGSSTPSLSIAGGLSVDKRSLFNNSISAIGNSNTVGSIFTTGGNVGIGTASPIYTLDVTGNARITSSLLTTNITSSTLNISTGITTANLQVKANNVSASIITTGEGENATLYLGTPYIGDPSNGLKTALIAQGKNTFSRARLHFCLEDSGSASTAPNATITHSRMMIDSNGSVGIGTTAPSVRFHVHSPNYQVMRLSTDSSLVTALELDSTNKTGGKLWRVMSTHDAAGEGQGKFVIQQTTNSLNALIIDSNGNIGIGTSSPSTKLSINGGAATSPSFIINSSGADSTLSLKNTGVGGREYWIGSASSGAGAGTGNLYFYDHTSGLTRMVLDSTGNLGIGTASPNGKLHVILGEASVGENWNGNWATFGQSGANASAVGIGYNSGSGGFIESISPGIAWKPLNYYASQHAFYNGNLGIGIAPTTKFMVSANGSSYASYLNPNGSGDQLNVRANAVNNDSGYFYYNSANNYGTISDKRIKQNISPLNTSEALNFITSLTPVSFSLNNTTEQQAGFIAQDIYNVSTNDIQKSALANWNTYDETNPDCPLMGVSDRPLISYLVAALKQLKQEFEDYKNKNQ